ncbi:hypothetical protein Plhal304r1_c049g0131631 [Plasmopara halstedii]
MRNVLEINDADIRTTYRGLPRAIQRYIHPLRERTSCEPRPALSKTGLLSS